MKKTLFIKQLDGGLWQWALQEAGDTALQQSDVLTGDAQALAESFEQQIPGQAIVMLSGHNVISQQQDVDESIKRHMAKLLPYEMEESIIDPVDDLAFSLSASSGANVDVVYTKNDNIALALEQLETVGCDVQKILPDYLCLQKNVNEIVFVVEDKTVYAKLGEWTGFAIELELVARVLSDFEPKEEDAEASIFKPLESGQTIRIVGYDAEKIDALKQAFPSVWLNANGPEIIYQDGDYWSSIDTENTGARLNLRKGRFARQLPFDKWINLWKLPAIVAAVAFVLALVSVGFESSQLKEQSLELRREIQSVYQEAVPNGRSRDPVRAVRSMLKGAGGVGKSSNALELIDVTAQALSKTPDITLTKMRYAGDKSELRINIETKNSGNFEKLRKVVTEAGFEAELLNVNRQGDKELASVRIAEKSS